VNFITGCPAPSVTTKPATNISSSSATLNGAFSALGGCTVTFSYTLIEVSTGIIQTYNLSGSTIICNVSGLKPNTLYRYRYAVNQTFNQSVTIYYGNYVEFTTTCDQPSNITTKVASDITSRSVTLQVAILQVFVDHPMLFVWDRYKLQCCLQPSTNSSITNVQSVSFNMIIYT